MAEVLITLGIIGIVAAMTLPTLITNNREKETVTKLKKINSVMNQAFTMAVNEYGTPDTWGFVRSSAAETDPDKIQNDLNGRDNVLKRMVPFLKTTFVCYYNDTSSCNSLVKYNRERYSLDGSRYGNWGTPKIILADGSSIDNIYMSNPECKQKSGTSKALQNVCGEVFVDLNGIKPPNATGKDVFWFWITQYGIVPGGTEAETTRDFDNYCNIKRSNSVNGYGCAAWVIYNENMEYLKCSDLSWNGKKKCK